MAIYNYLDSLTIDNLLSTVLKNDSFYKNCFKNDSVKCKYFDSVKKMLLQNVSYLDFIFFFVAKFCSFVSVFQKGNWNLEIPISNWNLSEEVICTIHILVLLLQVSYQMVTKLYRENVWKLPSYQI